MLNYQKNRKIRIQWVKEVKRDLEKVEVEEEKLTIETYSVEGEGSDGKENRRKRK